MEVVRRQVAKVSLIGVLVADDVESWRQLICAILRTERFEIVSEASDGLAAIQLAEQLQPTIVLLDIGLPGCNGMSVAREIRKLAPGAKIVFVTQECDDDVVRAALRLGAWGYVLKLDAARDLAAAIHSVLRGNRFVSSSLASHAFCNDVKKRISRKF